jgi:signal transduction histidine kinase
VGILKVPASLVPKSTEGQMTAILCISLLVLFTTLMVLEFVEHDTAMETAGSNRTVDRLRTLIPVLERIEAANLEDVVRLTSACHAGYTVTDAPHTTRRPTPETGQLERSIARELSVAGHRLRVGHAHLTREDFAYRKCGPWEIDLPLEAIVISLQLGSGRWLNAEVHPHEWHFRQKLDWMLKVGGAFVFVGAVAFFFMRRLNRPLNQLTAAARGFAGGIRPIEVNEEGPLDLRRAIRAFNAMQRQVVEVVARRTATLAAISHDVRTPLTALRVKAESIDDAKVRGEIIASVERMERITASALQFLQGESRGEPMRRVDLSALLESESSEFAELGHDVAFEGAHDIHCACRPDALARAVRNLIDNAVKYAGQARVGLRPGSDFIDIVVSDNGPGIPADQMMLAIEPFARLTRARDGDRSGFGLGLAVAKAVAEGHEGMLILANRQPNGLVVTLRLPYGLTRSRTFRD